MLIIAIFAASLIQLDLQFAQHLMGEEVNSAFSYPLHVVCILQALKNPNIFGMVQGMCAILK